MRLDVGIPMGDLLVAVTGSLNPLWATENTSIRLARQHKNGSQFCYLLALSAIWACASLFTSPASK